LAARNVTRDTLIAARVEVAGSPLAKLFGLMGRPGLGDGDGLWLPGSNGIHMMFMRFPIDAAFLGRPERDGTRPVVGLARALPVWRGIVPLVRRAQGVLELPAGAIDASRTQLGDLVLID